MQTKTDDRTRKLNLSYRNANEGNACSKTAHHIGGNEAAQALYWQKLKNVIVAESWFGKDVIILSFIPKLNDPGFQTYRSCTKESGR